MGLALIVRGFTDHEAGLRIAQDKPAPSTAADAMNLLHTQQKDPIFITRPHSTRGPPITIYHSAFADFRRNLKTGRDLEIPPEYYKIVSAFLVTSCALYASERERRNALLPFLKELCGQTITPGQFEDGYSSNGISATKVSLESMGTMALLLLLELKNEIGTGRCDPSTQASFSFTRWWATNDVGSRAYPYHTGADAGLVPTRMVREPGSLCKFPPLDCWSLGFCTWGCLTRQRLGHSAPYGLCVDRHWP